MTEKRPQWRAADQLGFPEPFGALIGGRWVAAGEADRIDVHDPGTEELIGTMTASDAETVDSAVHAAHRAFKLWAREDPVARVQALNNIAGVLRASRDSLAEAESIDSGKPLKQAYSDVDTAARYFEFYAGVADKIEGTTLPQPPGSFAYTLREPYGVVAQITPWNSPLSQMCRGAAAALAAGNAVVVKPSELTPLTTLSAAHLFLKAGLPEGLFNVVTGYGPATGATLVSHPLVQHVSFTGSVPTGRQVMALASERIVACNLELGGKSPTIIVPDADIEAASAAGAAAVLRNAGQSCFATTRLIVHRSIYERVAELIFAKMNALTVGYGLDDPDLGPLVSASQRARVRAYVELAEQEGAVVRRSSAAMPTGAGHFEAPVLLTGVENCMRVAQEEIFGPVQAMIRYDDEEEAIELANDSEYGLAAGVFTRDVATAHRLAARLEAGQVLINRYPAGGVETPFGGYKQSGIGREKGLAALEYYTQLKTVVLALD